MKLIDILTYVDKSDKNKHDKWSDSFTWLQDYLGIPNYGNLDHDRLESDNKLNLYWLTCWLCTDTWVGSIVIYFEGQPAGILYKSARKSSADAKFLSSDIKRKVKAYLIELTFMQEPEQEDDDIFSEGELNENEDPYYQVDYPSQILEKKAILDGSIPVTICPHSEQNRKWNNFEKVKVSIDETGKKKTVRINNLSFNLHISQPTN
jgi:hypothetical protein